MSGNDHGGFFFYRRISVVQRFDSVLLHDSPNTLHHAFVMLPSSRPVSGALSNDAV